MYEPKNERESNERLSDTSFFILISSLLLLLTDRHPEILVFALVGGSMLFNVVNIRHVVWLAQQPSHDSDPKEAMGLTYLFFYNLFLLLAGVARGGVALYMMLPPTE